MLTEPVSGDIYAAIVVRLISIHTHADHASKCAVENHVGHNFSTPIEEHRRFWHFIYAE